MRTQLLLVFLLISITCGAVARSQDSAARRELLVCGGEEVFALDVGTAGEGRKTWSWRAQGRKDLPEEYWTLFNTTDECRPVEGGRKVLISSSGGAVALVDRERDRVLFHAKALAARSAAMLPGNRIAVVANNVRTGGGNRLLVFDVARPEKEPLIEELPNGLGVVWDPQRELVWALGGVDLRVYRLRNWETATPRLERTAVIALPEGGGHDLNTVPGGALLTVTTLKHCWYFNRDARTFALHPQLGETAGLKGVSIHPTTWQTAYVQADPGSSFSDRLRFLNPERTIQNAGQKYYKMRWIDD